MKVTSKYEKENITGEYIFFFAFTIMYLYKYIYRYIYRNFSSLSKITIIITFFKNSKFIYCITKYILVKNNNKI